MNNGAPNPSFTPTRPATFCSPHQKPNLRVMRRQNRAALGYGREHTHSILSMALREFSNEMRLYGACKWDPWTEIVLPAFIASMRASDIACARVDDGSADLGDVEEGSPQDLAIRADAQERFADVILQHKKLQQAEEKLENTSVANKRARKRVCAKVNRAKVSISMAIRRCP